MILLVDIGNTAVKWGLCEAGEIVTADRFVHRDHDLAEQLNRFWQKLQSPAKVYVANVAGEDTGHALSAWVRRQWSLTPEYISTTGAACGVTNAYPVAGDLGVDRWMALIAAHHHSRGAVAIVDCGTAITLDWLTANGCHRGGLILPGIELLKKGILEDTAEVRPSTEMQAAIPFASSTGAGVQGGAVYLVVAAIDRIIKDMAASQNQDFEIIITGGDAGKILTLLAHSTLHDPELVLKGLAILAGGH